MTVSQTFSKSVTIPTGQVQVRKAAGDVRQAASRKRTGERVVAVLSPLLLLGVWEGLVWITLLDSRFFPAPSMIVGTLVDLVRTGELFTHLAISMTRIAVGFAIGAIPGILVGVAMGLSGIIRAAINPIVGAIYPIPKIAILPLILLIFGLGELSKYVIIAIAVFFLVLINTMAGVMNIEKIYLEVGRNFRASRFDAFRTIAIPGALPLIFAGTRLDWGVALLVIVAAEFVGAKSGLGYMIWQSWQIFAIETMYVGLIVIAFVGWASFLILDEIERYLVPWKPSHQK